MQSLSGSKFLLVTALGAGVAFVLSLVCRDHAVKAAVPVTFLLALVPVALIAGRVAGLTVTLVASLIFAVCLFEPYGSLTVRSAVDRIELLCFAMAALGMIHFSPSRESLPKTMPRSFAGSAPLQSVTESRNGTLKTSDPLQNWIAIVGYVVVFTALVTLLLNVWNSLRY